MKFAYKKTLELLKSSPIKKWQTSGLLRQPSARRSPFPSRTSGNLCPGSGREEVELAIVRPLDRHRSDRRLLVTSSSESRARLRLLGCHLLDYFLQNCLLTVWKNTNNFQNITRQIQSKIILPVLLLGPLLKPWLKLGSGWFCKFPMRPQLAWFKAAATRAGFIGKAPKFNPKPSGLQPPWLLFCPPWPVIPSTF